MRLYLLFFLAVLSFTLPVPRAAGADALPRSCRINAQGRLSCTLVGSNRGKASLNRFDPSAFPMDAIRKSKATLSIGSPWAGRLHRPAAMPFSGRGFILLQRTRDRAHGYALPELVTLILQAAAHVEKTYPTSVLTVGDLSPASGGYAPGHRSHQSGRDADIGFYLVDRRHRYQVITEEFVRFDGMGQAGGKYSHLLFDIERNWELVETLITHKSIHVQKIFISSPLRDLLLQYAEAVARPARVIHAAAAVLSADPAHGDHFHVRIECPAAQTYCR